VQLDSLIAGEATEDVRARGPGVQCRHDRPGGGEDREQDGAVTPAPSATTAPLAATATPSRPYATNRALRACPPALFAEAVISSSSWATKIALV